MKVVVAVVLFLSCAFFSFSVMSQTVSSEQQPSTGELQPPQYVPGQGEAGQGPDLRDRVLTERERRRLEREEIRRQRKIDKLNLIMSIEGHEFSQEKYDLYRRRMAGGIVLAALGGVSMFSGVLVVTSASHYDGGYHPDGCGEEECPESNEDEVREERENKEKIGLGMVLGGAVALGIGIPLMVSGMKGRKRQRYLKRKDEIMALNPGVHLGLSFDPSSNSGGLSLRATF